MSPGFGTIMTKMHRAKSIRMKCGRRTLKAIFGPAVRSEGTRRGVGWMRMRPIWGKGGRAVLGFDHEATVVLSDENLTQRQARG
jgi:hypothetical protein